MEKDFPHTWDGLRVLKAVFLIKVILLLYLRDWTAYLKVWDGILGFVFEERVFLSLVCSCQYQSFLTAEGCPPVNRELQYSSKLEQNSIPSFWKNYPLA